MNKFRIIYKILKHLDNGIEVKRENFEVSNQEWGDIAEMILDEGLAKGIHVTRGGRGNKVQIVWYDTAKITLTGLEFLEENDAFS